MNFVDKTMITLADPASRTGAFDETALEQIVSAGYDSTINAQGPFARLLMSFGSASLLTQNACSTGRFSRWGVRSKPLRDSG